MDPVIEAAVQLLQMSKCHLLAQNAVEIAQFEQTSAVGKREKKARNIYDPSPLSINTNPLIISKLENFEEDSNFETFEEDSNFEINNEFVIRRKRYALPVAATARNSLSFQKRDKVWALYNSWAGGKVWYEAVVLKPWYDQRTKKHLYQIVYDERYEGNLVTENVEAKFLRMRK